MSSSSMNLKKNSSDMPSKGENKTIFLILSTIFLTFLLHLSLKQHKNMVHILTLKCMVELFTELPLALFWGILKSNNTKHLDYIKTKKYGLSQIQSLCIHQCKQCTFSFSFIHACFMCNLKQTNKEKQTKNPPRSVD